MAVPTSVEEAYQRVQPALVALAGYVESTLRPWCDDNDYLYRGRIKESESLSEKLETGRFERWSMLDDLFACTIVIPTPKHEDGVLAFVQQAFQQEELRRRNSTKKAPEVFRFDTTRFIARVKPTAMAAGMPAGVDAIKFEIQIPTVFEHAWSVVTHDVVYKADVVDWRRARLAAQLKAAIEQIELVVAGFEENIDFVPRSEDPEVDALQRVVETFDALYSEGMIPEELRPKSWSRFAENVYRLVRSYSSRSQAPARTVELAATVDAYLRTNNSLADLRSGSLFQAVLGFVNSGVVPNGNINRYIIVGSSELRDVHQVTNIPQPFIFD
jgi:ppGpp synthetase/RelA/SpoT-type nucleotidyltranferase